jgi:hypothetical protein
VQDLQRQVETNAVFFRDHLRDARNRAIDDAEDFQALLHAFEQLGCILCGRIDALGGYAGKLNSLAGKSPLARVVPKQHREWHIPAAELVEIVRNARNDALHQGAYARHLTMAAIQLAIVLEDALMNGVKRASDLMVRNPVCAHPWQPISFIRQQMLAHSYSFLPVHFPNDGRWKFVSDLAVATYLRSRPEQRDERLAKTLQAAVSEDGLQLCPAQTFHADTTISDLLAKIGSVPVLICRKEDGQELVGILTAFDLL